MSRAVDVIREAARQVDQRDPSRLIRNLKGDCWQVLSEAVKIAGPEYAFVGKTSTMDGDGKITPLGFSPISMTIARDDGERVGITIVALSMDAVWHLPSMKQIKVIVNSTDGEIAAGGRGNPARLDSYEIEEFKADGSRQYRWHNPPISYQQVFGVQSPSQPNPPQSPQPAPAPFRLPSYAELGDAAFFAGTIGQAAEEDWHANGEEMNAGTADWIARAVHGTIERFIKNGDNRDAPAILKKVRNEWRAVMNNPKLPQL